jgi:hypothetical protein
MSTILQRHSRGILLQAKEDFSDRVNSDKMILRTVRREAEPQKKRPKVLKSELIRGGPPGLSPLVRSDGGWTSWEAAKDA